MAISRVRRSSPSRSRTARSRAPLLVCANPRGRTGTRARIFRGNMNGRFFVSTVLAITIGCGSIAFAQTANNPKDLPCKPVNLGLYKDQLTKYEESGQYSADLKAVDDQAMAYLTQQAKRSGKLALVLDIDETALSNWEEIRMNDYGRFSAGPCFPPKGPCGWTAWIDSAKSMAIEPTLELYRQARGQGLAIFFITGRHEHER